MKVAITGANGFVGQALAGRLSRNGSSLVALTRSPLTTLAGEPCTWIGYTLENCLNSYLPDDCNTVIHCAYDMATRGEGGLELNVNAAKAIRAAAAGRKFVFISSMSAHAGALSAYGRGKWAIEGLLNPQADLVIKPGFVIGNGGIYERLRRSIRRLPFVPLFYGGNQPIQTIWVDDLAEGVARAVSRSLTGTLILSSAAAVTLRQFYGAILASEGLRKPLVPLPGKASLLMLRLLEGLGMKLPMTSENLLGLLALRTFDARPSLDLVGLRPVTLADALRRTHPSG